MTRMLQDYTLSPDERGMLEDLAAAHQAAFTAELNVLLASIIRFRKLEAGKWKYDPNIDKTKLTRAE